MNTLTTCASCKEIGEGLTCTNLINIDNTLLTQLPIYTDIKVIDVTSWVDERISTTLSSQEKEQLLKGMANDIQEAAECSGVFMVKGHGVCISDILHEAQRFFDLPLEKKLALVPNQNAGYHPMGEENLNPSSQIYGGDYKEVVDFAEEFEDPMDPYVGQVFRPRNVWPDESDLSLFKQRCCAFQKQLAKVGNVVFQALALAMEKVGEDREKERDKGKEINRDQEIGRNASWNKPENGFFFF
ncbi:hypothetical protein HMI54_005933 [Coelomomyces lativittatus]|nr:hypothetical protein HMI54_005933 [Coelomomyces lativittatus]